MSNLINPLKSFKVPVVTPTVELPNMAFITSVEVARADEPVVDPEVKLTPEIIAPTAPPDLDLRQVVQTVIPTVNLDLLQHINDIVRHAVSDVILQEVRQSNNSRQRASSIPNEVTFQTRRSREYDMEDLEEEISLCSFEPGEAREDPMPPPSRNLKRPAPLDHSQRRHEITKVQYPMTDNFRLDEVKAVALSHDWYKPPANQSYSGPEDVGGNSSRQQQSSNYGFSHGSNGNGGRNGNNQGREERNTSSNRGNQDRQGRNHGNGGNNSGRGNNNNNNHHNNNNNRSNGKPRAKVCDTCGGDDHPTDECEWVRRTPDNGRNPPRGRSPVNSRAVRPPEPSRKLLYRDAYCEVCDRNGHTTENCTVDSDNLWCAICDQYGHDTHGCDKRIRRKPRHGTGGPKPNGDGPDGPGGGGPGGNGPSGPDPNGSNGGASAIGVR